MPVEKPKPLTLDIPCVASLIVQKGDLVVAGKEFTEIEVKTAEIRFSEMPVTDLLQLVVYIQALIDWKTSS